MLHYAALSCDCANFVTAHCEFYFWSCSQRNYLQRIQHGKASWRTCQPRTWKKTLESKRGRTKGKKKGTRKGNTVIIKRCGCGSVFSWHSEEARLLLFHSYFYYYSFFFLICALFSFAFSRSLLLFLLLLLLLLLLLYHSISCIKHR